MQVYALNGLSKARVWWGRDPFDGVDRPNSLTAELWIPRGAFAQYALLGASTRNDFVGVRVSGLKEVGKWDASLAGTVDEVRRGLPAEYRESVLRGGEKAVAAISYPGAIIYDCAAHAAVGSSPALFGRLAEAIAAILANRENFVKEDQMREILVDIAH